MFPTSTLELIANNISDGNIRYFEYENDKFEFLSEYKSGEPQRGIAFLPRRGINVSNLPDKRPGWVKRLIKSGARE